MTKVPIVIIEEEIKLYLLLFFLLFILTENHTCCNYEWLLTNLTQWYQTECFLTAVREIKMNELNTMLFINTA